MKASQEPLEETKVGGGDLVVYPTLPGKPVQSQDTLRRKLLKACAGSNPTWIGAPSCFHSLVRSSALTKLAKFCSARQTPSSDPHTGWSLPSLAVPQACRLQLFGRHLVDDGFTSSLSQPPAQNAVDSHFTGFGFDKVCETKPSCTGAEKARCVA